MRLKALVEIYTMHSFARLQNHVFSKKNELGERCIPKTVQRSALSRSRRELSNVPFLNLLFEQIANSNEYLFANFGFSFFLREGLLDLACLLASIQPRTSLVKFARSPRTDRPDYYYRS